MKLDRGGQIESSVLSALASEAVDLLYRGDFKRLATRFGYALCFERTQESAIRHDFERALHELGASGLAPLPPEPLIKVGYFAPNGSGLLALVEHWVPTENGRSILVELVATGNADEAHFTVEEISASDT